MNNVLDVATEMKLKGCGSVGQDRYCYGAGAQSDPRTAAISDLTCVPISDIITPDSSTRALWKLPAETSSIATGETWTEMDVEFCLLSISFILVRFFKMP
jgi:hypothetical protein